MYGLNNGTDGNSKLCCILLQASFNTTPPKPLDGVANYQSGPGVATGVRPLRHLSPADYTSTQPPPSRLTTPSYPSVSGPAVYLPGVARTHGQPQPAGFPGVADCHGNPAGGVYPTATSCHQQPSPVSAAFTTQQPAPHNYPVSLLLHLAYAFKTQNWSATQ